MSLSYTVNRLGAAGPGLLAALLLVGNVRAQEGTSPTPGRVEFDHPGSNNPTVDLDLTGGLLADMLGLGDAAIAGIASGITQGTAGHESAANEIKMATAQIEAVRAILDQVEGLIDGVHVQVYKGGEEGSEPGAIAEHYSNTLPKAGWERVARVRDDDKQVTIFASRNDGAIRGIFVCASDGNQQVVGNLVCNLSPDQVKKLTELATRTGLQMGGDQAIQQLVEGIRAQQNVK